MSFAKSVATIGGLTMISRVLGFIRDVISAALLGAGPVADAAFVAFRLPNLFRRLFAEGAFNTAFVPLFSGKLEQTGQDEAEIFAEQAQAMLLLILIPLTILIEIFMPVFLHFIAPGFAVGTERYALAVILSRITFPYLIFISLSSLQGGVLNALERYWAYASAPILFNLCLILGFGLTPFMPTPGHALAWGEALAGVVQFLWMLRACRLAGVRLRLRQPRLTPMIRRLFTIMGPAAISGGSQQINTFIDMIISSILPTGAISYLYYADRVGQLPLGVIGIAIATALLPILSRHAKAGRLEDLRLATARAVEMSVMLALPAAVALMISARPIMAALFMRDAFTESDVLATASALRAYAVGIPAAILVKILMAGFFARENTRTPLKFSLITIAANTVLALSLIHWLSFTGIALATGVTTWINVGLLGRRLIKDDLLIIDARLRSALLRLLLCAAGMACVLLFVQHLFQNWWIAGNIKRIAALSVLVGGGGATYITLAFATGAINRDTLKLFLRRGGASAIKTP